MERLTKRAYGKITYSKERDVMCSSFATIVLLELEIATL